MCTSLSSNWTTHDVVVYYKRAADKLGEVEKLAELTGTDIDTIIEILKDAGVFKGRVHICGRCGHEFPSIYKKIKNPLCPDCRDICKEIAEKEWKLKRNIARIASLAIESQRLREEIDEMKEVK